MISDEAYFQVVDVTLQRVNGLNVSDVGDDHGEPETEYGGQVATASKANVTMWKKKSMTLAGAFTEA